MGRKQPFVIHSGEVDDQSLWLLHFTEIVTGHGEQLG